jgi:hypothetical protein
MVIGIGTLWNSGAGRTAFHPRPRVRKSQKVLSLITEVFATGRPVNALFTMLAEVLTHAAFGR